VIGDPRLRRLERTRGLRAMRIGERTDALRADDALRDLTLGQISE
jgi:hypothetical protein